MKTAFIIKIVCLVLTVVLLTGVLVYFLNGSSSFINFPIFTSYSNSSKYTVGGGSFDADEVNSIEIDWISGEIEIKKGEGNKISFYEESENLNEDEKMRYYLDGSTLKLQFSAPNWLSGLSLGKKHVKKLYITVPADKDFKSFSIDQISSELLISDIAVKELDIDNISGRITIRNVKAQSFDCDTVSGDINAVGSFTDIDCDTTSASLDITSDICPREISCDSVSGSIRLCIPDNDGFSAEMNSLSGKFTSEFALKSIEKELYIYKNAVNEFEFDTVSGDVKILQK